MVNIKALLMLKLESIQVKVACLVSLNGVHALLFIGLFKGKKGFSLSDAFN